VLWQKFTELGEIDDFHEHDKEIVAFLGAHSDALPRLGRQVSVHCRDTKRAAADGPDKPSVHTAATSTGQWVALR
jgi:hypothetical protein